MLIKICGLTRRSDAELAESLGADFLGAIMAGGPRNLEPSAVAAVLGPPRHRVRRGVVFAQQSRSEIAELATRLSLEVVQLHGDNSVEDIAWLRARVSGVVWPVLRVDGIILPTVATEMAQAAGALLLDAKVVGQLGGTGVQLDWSALRHDVLQLREAVPGVQLILAGGIRASNVQHARDMLSPDAIDVSSGVEKAPGLKDAAAMEALITAARSTTKPTTE